MIALQYVGREGRQRYRRLAERHHEVGRFLPQLPGALPAAGDPEQAGVGQLTSRRVLLHALPRLVGVTFDVEQVIRYLKQQTEALSVGVDALEQSRGWPGRRRVTGEHP